MNNVCHVARTTDEWQFGDGPPGQPSADYADITLPRWTDALFKFHLTKHSLRLVDPRDDIPRTPPRLRPAHAGRGPDSQVHVHHRS